MFFITSPQVITTKPRWPISGHAGLALYWGTLVKGQFGVWNYFYLAEVFWEYRRENLPENSLELRKTWFP